MNGNDREYQPEETPNLRPKRHDGNGTEGSEQDHNELFLTLHSQNLSRLSAFVHTLVPAWHDAEEIIQDSVVVLWRKFDQFDQSTSFFSWAARISQYEVLNYRRANRRNRVQVLADQDLELLATEAIDQLDDIELQREAIERCLEQLSDRDRELIQVRYREDGDIHVAAELLQRTTGHTQRVLRAIRSALFRCVKRRLAEVSSFKLRYFNKQQDSPMRHENDSLEDLTWKYLDGTLTEEESQLLSDYLQEDLSRHHFIDLNKLHFTLGDRLAKIEQVQTTAQTYSSVHNQLISETASRFEDRKEAATISYTDALSANPSFRIAKYVNRYTAGIAAASLLCCVGFFALKGYQGNDLEHGDGGQAVAEVDVPESNNTVANPSVRESSAGVVYAARIVSISEDAAWGRSKGKGDFLMRLLVGEEVRLVSGVAKLEFASGATAVLSGPTHLDIISPSEVVLHSGKLTGHCENGNFIVSTPTAHVVDVGTAFGVMVDQHATQVVVFEGEVDVQAERHDLQTIRLTSGMTIRADQFGLAAPKKNIGKHSFDRDFNGERPGALGQNEISFVDIICGSSPGEFRTAGSIDPNTGTWSSLPWSELKGVRGKRETTGIVPVKGNRWVHGIFVPDSKNDTLLIDSEGGSVAALPISGGAWGPVWARRRIDRHLDPLWEYADNDVEGFWGAGTTTALLDRSRWVRDGIVGLHANVGITIDLDEIRREYASPKAFRGIIAHLEKSHASRPFHPQAMASFQVLVDGETRYKRIDFSRSDGDEMFGLELNEGDRFITLIVTDSGDGPIYDRVVMLDPVLELCEAPSE